jgi:LCP family protein required for cell wall assembly
MQKVKIGWWILAGVLGIILIALIIFYVTYSKMVVKPNKVKTNVSLTATATPTPDPLAPYSILLMGYGGGAHQGGLLTDSIMVAKIDPKNQEISLISVPRDLWVPIPVSATTTESKKINEAYAIGSDDKKYPNKSVEFTGEAGGGEMAKSVIGQVLGIKIDYFAALDFDGFVKVINLLGGVDINVANTFDDPKYPLETNIDDTCGKTDDEVKALTATMSGDLLESQFPCRYEDLHFNKGMQHMDGTTALKFARSRHSLTDGGDFNRAARQRLVVTAVRDKIISIGFIPKIIPTIQTLTNNLTTDINFGKMNELVGKAVDLSKYKIVPIALTDQNVLTDTRASTGQAILSPKAGENNWDEIHQFIENKGIMLTPTASATTSATIKTQN